MARCHAGGRRRAPCRACGWLPRGRPHLSRRGRLRASRELCPKRARRPFHPTNGRGGPVSQPKQPLEAKDPGIWPSGARAPAAGSFWNIELVPESRAFVNVGHPLCPAEPPKAAGASARIGDGHFGQISQSGTPFLRSRPTSVIPANPVDAGTSAKRCIRHETVARPVRHGRYRTLREYSLSRAGRLGQELNAQSTLPDASPWPSPLCSRSRVACR